MWIPDPFRGDASAVDHSGFCNLPKLDGWLVKMKETTLNEVAGYQFASLLGLGLPKSQWFVLEKPIRDTHYRMDRGEVGMLIEPLRPSCGESVESLAGSSPELAARILCLWSFMRCEWGEIWSVDGRIILIDLEFMLARFETSRERRASRMEDYEYAAGDAVQHALGVARSAQIERQYRAQVREVSSIVFDTSWSFDYISHRRRSTIEMFLMDALRRRMARIREIAVP